VVEALAGGGHRIPVVEALAGGGPLLTHRLPGSPLVGLHGKVRFFLPPVLPVPLEMRQLELRVRSSPPTASM